MRKLNAELNKLWAKHIRRRWKKATSGIRRMVDKIEIRKQLNDNT